MEYAHSETPESVRQAMGNAIRHRREDLGETLSEVAEAAAMSTAYVSEIERGLKDVSTEKLVAVARALELSVADLYLNLARRLGSQEALRQRGSWPNDPRAQLRAASATLRPNALRSVADFSLYLVATQTNPTKRRIGFTIDR